MMNIEINIFTVLAKDLKNVSERNCPLSIKSILVDSLTKDTAEIETRMEGKSSPETRQTDVKTWFGLEKYKEN